MKQLSDTEKQKLERKIKDEQERQQGLQEMNPNTPTTSTENKFTPSNLWKYSVFGIILLKIAVSSQRGFFCEKTSQRSAKRVLC